MTIIRAVEAVVMQELEAQGATTTNPVHLVVMDTTPVSEGKPLGITQNGCFWEGVEEVGMPTTAPTAMEAMVGALFW
jgi:hypothetical protein